MLRAPQALVRFGLPSPTFPISILPYHPEVQLFLYLINAKQYHHRQLSSISWCGHFTQDAGYVPTYRERFQAY